jgi:hypothetical protein
MTRQRTAIRWLVALLFVCAAPAFSQPSVRGGWVADVGGVRHIYIFKVHDDDTFTGTHCTRCDEREDISIVRKGQISGARLSFSLLSDSSGEWREQRFEGDIGDGEILLRRVGAESAPQRLVRVQGAAPTPAAAPAAAPPPAPYVAPGPPEPLTLESMAGTWISGTGARAQILMLKVLDGQLVGLICGPCDSPVTMAPIEDGSVDGTRVEIFTVHEDNGRIALYGRYRNDIVGSVAKHQLRIDSHLDGRPGENEARMTFIGPIRK